MRADDRPCPPCPELELELPPGLLMMELHCPACGLILLGQEDYDPCQHLLYLALAEQFEPMYVAPHFQAGLPALPIDPEARMLVQEELDFLELAREQIEASSSRSILRFCLKSSGLSCPTSSSTLYAAFDLSVGAELL